MSNSADKQSPISATKQSPLIRLADVGVQFHNKTVLEKVDLDIHPGELITLIGPNGAGKTTLLKTLLNLQTPTSGKITRADELIIGYVPQKLQIDNTMPIQVSRFMALTPGINRRQVKSELDRVGALHTLDYDIHSLSGGEFQRVMLARAILRSPSFLALDEPVQGVDIAGQTALYKLIEQLHQELKCAVLMVSHDLHWVMASTHRVICLNRHICCSGHPESVSNDPSYQEFFGANVGPMAFYNHHHDHHHHHDDPNPVITEEDAP